VHAFQTSNQLVTNKEYLEFMEAGGYSNFNYWLAEGWDWVNRENIKSPFHWHKIGGNWYNYELTGSLCPVDTNKPVTHINYYEADAYARWKGRRLLTEFEWEAGSDRIPWGERWEWTNSAYLPYPGFRAMEGAAREYNGKFMVNQMVLRGASVGTSPGHSRKTYRNFFHPHFQWQFSGIRLSRELA